MVKKNVISILMLGGARRVSLGELLKQSGARLGHEVKLYSYELTRQVPIACVAKVILGKRWDDPDVVDEICNICNEYGIDIILPFVDGALGVASRCALKLPDLFVPGSKEKVSSVFCDKIRAASAFKTAGIPIPHTYSAVTARVPAIAKPRFGNNSRGIRVFHNLEELMHLPDISGYLVQEYTQHKDEYTVDCYVAADGRVLCTVPRRRLEVMGGEVTRSVTCRNETLIKMSRDVLAAFDLRGPVTLQFLHDLDKSRFLLMEVNARLGGGVICSIYAGAPIADYIIKEAMGVSVHPALDWSDGTLMARYWKETIFYNG